MYVESPDAIMCFASVITSPAEFFACDIIVLLLVVPSPTCPYSLYPTPHTVLSSFIITAWYLPPDISFTPYNTLLSVSNICCGSETSLECPIPNPP